MLPLLGYEECKQCTPTAIRFSCADLSFLWPGHGAVNQSVPGPTPDLNWTAYRIHVLVVSFFSLPKLTLCLFITFIFVALSRAYSSFIPLFCCVFAVHSGEPFNALNTHSTHTHTHTNNISAIVQANERRRRRKKEKQREKNCIHVMAYAMYGHCSLAIRLLLFYSSRRVFRTAFHAIPEIQK